MDKKNRDKERFQNFRILESIYFFQIVLGKFSKKLKEANQKDKDNSACINGLNVGIEQAKKEADNLNKKLEEMSLQIVEKDEALTKLREEHQSR